MSEKRTAYESLENAIAGLREWMGNDDITAPIQPICEAVGAFDEWKAARDASPIGEERAREVACLADILDIWRTWPGRSDVPATKDAMASIHNALVRHGLIRDGVTPAGEALLTAARGEPGAGEDTVSCPRCGRTKSVSRWTNEQTGEPFYVCSTPPPGNGCGHSFAHPTAEAPAVPERLTCEGAPCPSRYHGIACEKRGRHDTHGTLDGLNMWLSHVADLDARGGGQ